MKNTEYNQALVKKAQAGLVRFQGMQKNADLEDLIREPSVPSSGTPEYTKDYFDNVVNNPIRHNPDVVEGRVNGSMDVKPEETSTVASAKPTNPYLRYAVGGAGVGALVGTLINLVRNKSLLSGALVGAGIGGGLGAGHKYLSDNNETYGNWKNNPIESGFQSGFKAYDDLLSKFKK